MTKTKLNFAVALLAGSLICTLSVFALSDGEEEADQRSTTAAAMGEINVEEIQAQVESALEGVPWEEISRQLADVQGILDGVDPEAIRAQVEAAMADLDVERIRAEAREALDDVDWDEIRRDIEAAHAEIETMDLEGVRADVLQALDDVDWDEIRKTLQDAKGMAAGELEALDEILKELGNDGSGVI